MQNDTITSTKTAVAKLGTNAISFKKGYVIYKTMRELIIEAMLAFAVVLFQNNPPSIANAKHPAVNDAKIVRLTMSWK